MDTSVLEDLGLTHAEIKVYLTMLELGSSSAGPILERSGLQNSVVHRSLNTLIDKGVINFILEGRRKVYQATDPEYFFRFIDDKKERFKSILPDLKRKQSMARKVEAATIYKGVRGVNEVYNIMVNTPGKEYLTFGGGKECEARMGGSWWMGVHRKRIANRLRSRQVFDETVRAIGEDIGSLPISQVRFVGRKFEQFQETVVVRDKVAITVFTEHPYSFLIRDKVVAEGYRKHFELLWGMAKG